PLLYVIAELADGNRTNEEIAAAVSEAIKRGVSADNIRELVDSKLRPLGIFAGADGSSPEVQKLDPMLALRLRTAVVPPSAVNADVTDAYRLGKAGRLRTDLGGVYFNTIFILATAGAYALTGFEPLLLMIPLQHLEIIHQFLPFIRLDGYYIVSDLTGVPDMFARIKPTLRSLVPWLPTDESVTELRPWVRVAVTVYVLTVVPLLL